MICITSGNAISYSSLHKPTCDLTLHANIVIREVNTDQYTVQESFTHSYFLVSNHDHCVKGINISGLNHCSGAITAIDELGAITLHASEMVISET